MLLDPEGGTTGQALVGSEEAGGSTGRNEGRSLFVVVVV